MTHKHHWYFYPGLVLLVLVLLLGGLLCFMTVTEYRPAPVEAAQQGAAAQTAAYDGGAFRIVSFNTGYASLGRDADFLMDGGRGPGVTERSTVEANMAGIEEVLQKAQADFYILQEVDQDCAGTDGINQLEAYGAALPQYHWAYGPNFVAKFVPYPITHPFGRMDSGVVTYSRFAMSEAQRISLPVPFAWPIRTANLKRCMLLTRVPIEGTEQELVVINFHLEAYDDGEGKTAQTTQLLELLEEEYAKGNFVIAGGDFNQIFPEVETDLKETSEWVPGDLDPLPESMEGWRYVYDDSVPTCRLLNQPYAPDSPLTQYYVIDGFIVSPNLEVEAVQTLDEDFRFSDHNPVVMEVRPVKN